MKKRSAFLTSSLSFIVLYSVYLAAFVLWDADRSYTRDWPLWVSNTASYSRVGEILLKNGEVYALDEQLATALGNGEIHFYAIRRDGKDVVYANAAGPTDQLELVDFPGTYDAERYRYTVVQAGEYQLAVGHKKAFSDYLTIFLKNRLWITLLDIASVLIGTVVISLICFRDLRQVLKRIATRGAKRGDIAIAKSSETLTLVRGLSGFESQAEELAKQKEIFRTQVLGALRKELESGKKPPYEFDCTLVRSDINNFTQIFTGAHRAEFMEVINEFFVGVTHLVSRYGGSIYEFVGDEVLFYFKDQDHENSSATAIAALRDINKLALKMSERTEQEGGYAFRIKSSLSHGTLRFGPLVDAFALAGPPLIESVRMLSHVHEKSENTVLFDESLTDSVADLCRSKRQQVVMLKGLQGARTLVSLEAFTPLSLHLRQGDEKGLKLTKYYRDDQDICEILDFVTRMQGKLDAKELNKLVSMFRAYTVAKSSAAIKRSFIECLNQTLQIAEANEQQTFLLASIVSAANHILTKKEWSGDVRASMYGCLTHPNRRVVANALDAFSNFEPEAAEKIFNQLAKEGDNRIVANLLVKEAKRDWNKKVAKKLKAMLAGQSPYLKASGLYALGEAAKYLRSTDEIAFSADNEMQALLESAEKLSSHANTMVVRQAQSALGKAGRNHASVTATSATSAQDSQSNVVSLRKQG
jgi:class 3 adenylate cyclase